ncbi:MAG TPA: sodium-dependent transporter [Prolixibacteraceae bacterium]|nr:sodium-dependent transporter [Prolixibacteraceae bacterium]HOS00516.1 sodium-dependent transporter [Prolixibacteraceae bacterium]HOS90902.1 sodium-dependent transporter [Prolixibacteraceae bacterium]HPL45731.1 sodium-dependent transporter [Prolixibacteraceae bacterium]HQE52772.1 sodium-dependent transporter [Prolixibacteraceae bacterium]
MKNIGNNQAGRESFTTKFGVIAATAGSAVGLGNIWRFPYLTGENGGAAFLVIYLVFVLVIGIPVMLSEFVIGRSARKNPYGAFKKLAPGKPWYLVGLMGVTAAFMILAFYTTVAGWTLEYLYQSVTNGFVNKDGAQLSLMFSEFRSDTLRPLFWFLIFMGMTAGIIVLGVRKGIEKSTVIMMPLLFVILVILGIRSLTLPGSLDGLRFLFKPDFSKIDSSAILDALGQVFFSMSIGMGTLITYASYFPARDRLLSTSFSVALTDTLVAVLAGIVIFPAAFSFHIAPDEGTGLVFVTLPGIFQQMPGGAFFASLFFLLLAVAALTSTISVLEVIVAFFVEELRLRRKMATWIAAGTVSLLGMMCTLSWNSLMEGVSFFGLNTFELLDYTSANILLPIGGFFIALFVAWFFGREKRMAELSNDGSLKAGYIPVYIFIIRFLAPIALAFIFLNGIGLLKM